MRMNTRLVPLLLTGVTLSIIALAMLNRDNDDQRRLESKPLPAFHLEALDGNTMVDASRFKGKLTLLNVWASWCGVCMSEHPFLMDLAQSEAITVVGVNYRDERLAAKQTLAQWGNPYQAVIFDQKGSLALDLGVYGTPESYLIDAQGVIRYRYRGALNEKVWQQQFEPVIQMLTQPSQQGVQHAS